MNRNLLQLKKKFGGSWALWDKDGGIVSLTTKHDFEFLLKPNIVFVGLNASIELSEDWINYHSECQKFKKKKWGQEFIKNLADLIMSSEFSFLRGAYMTDIIKDIDFPKSSKVIKEIKSNPPILLRNKEIFERELRLLSKLSSTNKFQVICMGRDAFDILCRAWNMPTKRIPNEMRFVSIKKYNNFFDILETYHYSYRKKENIRKDLREIIKKL